MAKRFQHVLVPVDFSDVNHQAIEVAIELAMQNRADLTLLHVIETLSQDAGEDDQEIDEFYSTLETKAATKLAAIVAQVAEENVSIKREILIGHSVQEIIQFSIDCAVDMIVINSQRVNLDRPQEGWGSVSYQVSILAQCPVLLVK